VTPCPPDRIRARRRPGAIALLWAARLLASLLVAWPIAGAFRALGAGRGAERDAVLFEPGALFLLEALRLGDRALLAALQSAAFSWAVFALLLLVPIAALLVALAHEGRLELGAWLGRALHHVPRFLLLAGVTLLGQALVIAGFALAHGGVQRLWLGRVSERSADLFSIAWFGVAAAAVLLLSLLQDLARAASVTREERASDSLVHAIATFRERPGRVTGSWLAVALASSVVVALAAWSVDAAHIERAETWRIVTVTAIHQFAALALAALRGAWLAFSLRVVGARPADLTPQPDRRSQNFDPVTTSVAPR
jgi:hypothetical protein